MTATVSESSLGPEWAWAKPSETPPSQPTHFPKAPPPLGRLSTCGLGGDTNNPFVTTPSSSRLNSHPDCVREFGWIIISHNMFLLISFLTTFHSVGKIPVEYFWLLLWSLEKEDPLEKEWQLSPVFLSGESHGQGSLADYSPWGPKDLDTS